MFVRLTPVASLYFKNLSFEEKSIFSQNLTNQLAELVPIPDNRIIVGGHYQIDSTDFQILIPIKILESNNNSVIGVSIIVNTLDILIKNKEMTLISKNSLTSMLDESYGLKERSK